MIYINSVAGDALCGFILFYIYIFCRYINKIEWTEMSQYLQNA